MPAPPTEREVTGLNLPFDQEMDARCPLDSVRVGETASKVQLVSAGGATSFLLGEGLPPIPAKLVAKIQKCDFVDIELLRDNMEAERMVPTPQAGNRHRVGGRCPTY